MAARLWAADSACGLPLLFATPVETTVLRHVQGPVIVVTDRSQDKQAHGWAVVLIDSVGIVANANSGALPWCGSSWAAEWCAKGVALWLLQTLDIAPSDVCGIIADNLATSFGTTGGSYSHFVWVDTIVRHCASYLAACPIKKFYVPAQHDTRRLDLVAGWQVGADRLAKAGLRLARARVIPLPSLLADLQLLYCEGCLVCNVFFIPDARYSQTCEARAPTPEGYDIACWERCLLSSLLPNGALKFACCLRMAPQPHVSPKANLHCYLCRAPCHSWGQHLYSDCMSTALACLHGFTTLALSLQLESPVQWLAVDRIRVSVDGDALQWTLLHPAAAPGSDPLTDVALSWSGAIAVRPQAPLSAESRDAPVRTFLSTIAQWEVLDPLPRPEAICEAPDPPRLPAPFPWAAVAVASSLLPQRRRAVRPHLHPPPPPAYTLPSGASICAWRRRHPPLDGQWSGSSQIQMCTWPPQTGYTLECPNPLP